MFHEFILAFISGALVKIVDELDDKKNKMVYVFAIAYGVAIGFLVSSASFSMLFLGALLAQLVAGKIDKKSHMLGFAAAIAVITYLGIPQIDAFALIIFFISAFLDEQEFRGSFSRLNTLTKYRAFLKIAALLFVFVGRSDYFITVILFDIAYLISQRLVTIKK